MTDDLSELARLTEPTEPRVAKKGKISVVALLAALGALGGFLGGAAAVFVVWDEMSDRASEERAAEVAAVQRFEWSCRQSWLLGTSKSESGVEKLLSESPLEVERACMCSSEKLMKEGGLQLLADASAVYEMRFASKPSAKNRAVAAFNDCF